MEDGQQSEQNTITDAVTETANTAAADAVVVNEKNDASPETGDSVQQEEGSTLLGAESKAEADDQGQTSEEAAELELNVAEDSLVNEQDTGSVLEFAKQHDLSPELAQATLDLIANTKTSTVTEVQEKQNEAYQQQVEDWKSELANDPKIGGEHFPETDRKATKTLLKFWGESFFKEVQANGIGAHPDFVRGLVALADHLAPDTLHQGETVNAMAELSPEQRLNTLYPAEKL